MGATTPDYYAILGVSRDASQDDIERAYRRLAQVYQGARPDAASGDRLGQVRQAYDVLSDAQMRAVYDIRWEATFADERSPASGGRQVATSAVGVPAKPWGIPAVLLAIAVPFTLWAGSLAIAIASDPPESLSDGEVISGLILNILVLDGIFIAAPALFCLVRYGLGWSGLGFRSVDVSFWWIPPVAAAAAHVGIIVYGTILVALGAGTPEQDIDDLFDSRIVLPMTAVAVVLVAPLAEELFFRGFVFAGLIRPIGVYGAMVASGLLFAAFHVTGPDSAALVPPFAAIGMLFAWIYYRTGSLWPSIASHFIFNLVSFAILAAFAAEGS